MTQFVQFIAIAAIIASCVFFGAVKTAAYAVIAILIFLSLTIPAYWDR